MHARGVCMGLPMRGSFGRGTPMAGALVINQQPSINVLSGVVMLAQPVVAALSNNGVLDTSFDGPITLTALGGPVLNGTVTVNAVAGLAPFVGLSLTGPGTATLTATNPDRMPASTNTITVT